jgi:hypothetical protein
MIIQSLTLPWRCTPVAPRRDGSMTVLRRVGCLLPAPFEFAWTLDETAVAAGQALPALRLNASDAIGNRPLR